MNDEKFIDIAIDISKTAKYPYGAIIVKDDEIIGRSDDITIVESTMYSHAELEAIESASKDKNLYGDLAGATLYVSCEPCMMCMGAILYEGISKIVYAATLQDSNDYYCPEMLTNIDELSKYANNKIEIVKELHRDKAVEVLEERGLSENSSLEHKPVSFSVTGLINNVEETMYYSFDGKKGTVNGGTMSMFLFQNCLERTTPVGPVGMYLDRDVNDPLAMYFILTSEEIFQEILDVKLISGTLPEAPAVPKGAFI